MSLSYRHNSQPYALEITDIIETSERVITVRLKDTGKPVSIRRDLAQIYGNLMYVPYWLAVRLLNDTDKIDLYKLD